MRFGISTWNYLKPFGKSANLSSALRKIGESGFGAELWLDWTAEPGLLERSRWPEIRPLCSTLPWLSAHTRLIKYFSMETLREDMDLCSYLGADPLVCHPRSFGLDVSTWTPRWDSVLSKQDRNRIGTILQEAADRSLRLALENGPLDLLTQVMEGMADHPAFDHLGVCIDSGHANMHGRLYESPTLTFVRNFRESMIHLHAHDNRGEEDEHLVPGSGSIGWPRVLEELAGNHYRGKIVFELADDDPEAAAERALSFVHEHFREAAT